MECSACGEPVSRASAWRNDAGKGNSFCCYECNASFFSHRTMPDKHKKINKHKRIKPPHRDFEE